MTEEEMRLKQELRSHGLEVPEWLVKQKPTLSNIEGVEYLVLPGGVYFEAEQFSLENSLKRWELIVRHSN